MSIPLPNQFITKDKHYVLQFLAKVHSEHGKQIHDLNQKISHLAAQKKELQERVKEIQTRLKQIGQENNSLVVKLKKDGHREKPQQIEKLLRSPWEIVKEMQAIKPTPISRKQEPKPNGSMTCVVWSRDGVSLEKFENIEPEFASDYLKKNLKVIQILLIHNPPSNKLVSSPQTR